MTGCGRVLPANSIQRNVLYQTSIRFELKALLPKRNQYFFCWFGDGYHVSYAIHVSPLCTFYVGWIRCMPLYNGTI